MTARLWRWLFAAAVAGHLTVLYLPRPVSAGGVPQLDKAVHVAVFAAVAWTGLRALVPPTLLLPALALHAVVSELLQATVLPDRGGDPWDVLADLLGVLAGTALARASWRRGHVPAA